ncbi:hypothetical protein [Xenorhabdus bovienii]|uniref:Glycosyltransferase RgtA/B/C/D-like domain-containing protein n=1 Tax=Xenorhabdus bovienii str. kraussei Becker Underwood TaxID=1398204 RepID=A0A077Q114_XENBV|nr:hypothetical protein [Xenorhabdus bovienii]CDH25639.1 conserved hypothetical protein; putative inner membrane protein; CPS-53 (KpLE1) prophage [Xenorhabdus bovienii str. kraussei Becker Underwood]
MKTKNLDRYIIIIFSLLIAFLSKNISMANQGDFYRVVAPFINNIDIPSLSYQLKDNFSSILSFDYKSSYSLIIYFYSGIISLFTNTLDIQIISLILKIVYIFILYEFFLLIERKNNKYNAFFFIIFCFPLMSSANLSLFSSFYQEQVLLIFLPLFLITTFSNTTKSIIIGAISITIMACSKSQFFYIPIFILVYYVIFNQERLKLKIPLMLLSLLISISFILFSTGATNLNKYHSNYFGIYKYMQIHNIQLPEKVQEECIGIDAWGNKYDFYNGAIHTEIGEKCFWDNNTVDFSDAIKEILKHPLIILNLPYDDSMKNFYGENYFHVYKASKLIQNNTGVLSNITDAMDYLFNNLRFSLLLLCMIIPLFFRGQNFAGTFFILGCLGVSQLYISFIGEGYRDINKHLFGMNLSFDFIIFYSFSLIHFKLSKLYSK